MGYIGKEPEHGRFSKVDQINSGFDASAATFNLTVDSVAVYPINPQNLLVSLGGVIQQPGTDYTISSATVTFTTAPASSTDFFGILLGDVLDVGTPSDGSITLPKMAPNSVDSDQYVDGSIDRVHLAADIIDGTKIADDVINSEHYAASSIDNEHLADNAVNTAEIANDAVTYAKLQNLGTADRVLGSASTGLIGEVQIVADMIADDAVTYAKLQNLSTADRVLGSESTGLIGEVQIVPDMVASNAITTIKILDNAVTLAKMAGITRGSIIYGDSSGDPAALALGASGLALKSDGSDLVYGSAGVSLGLVIALGG